MLIILIYSNLNNFFTSLKVFLIKKTIYINSFYNTLIDSFRNIFFIKYLLNYNNIIKKKNTTDNKNSFFFIFFSLFFFMLYIYFV